MWYEILPTFGILITCITCPPICAYFLHKLVQNGNPYKRDVRTNQFDEGLLHRDRYLFKKPYVIQGLNNIPDDVNSDGKTPGDNSGSKTACEKCKEKDRCKCNV